MANGRQIFRAKLRSVGISDRQAEMQHNFFVHFVAFVMVNLYLYAINMHRNPDCLWCHWVVLSWGIGLTLHAVRAYRPTSESQSHIYQSFRRHL